MPRLRASPEDATLGEWLWIMLKLLEAPKKRSSPVSPKVKQPRASVSSSIASSPPSLRTAVSLVGELLSASEGSRTLPLRSKLSRLSSPEHSAPFVAMASIFSRLAIRASSPMMYALLGRLRASQSSRHPQGWGSILPPAFSPTILAAFSAILAGATLRLLSVTLTGRSISVRADSRGESQCRITTTNSIDSHLCSFCATAIARK